MSSAASERTQPGTAPRRALRLATGGVLALVVAGCSGPSQVQTSSGDMAAVGETWVQYGTLDNSLVFVIWSDISLEDASLSGTGGGGPAPRGVKANYHGQRFAKDGRKVEWEAATSDGKTGTVTINGAEYRLQDGPVFLVTTRGDGQRAQQVIADLSALKPTAESWERLAKERAEVKEYLARVGARK